MRIQHQPLPSSAHLCVGLVLLSLCGCHSWNANAFPLQNASRVPPPSTGNIPAAGGYYNNTSGLAPQGNYAVAPAGGFNGGQFPSGQSSNGQQVVVATNSEFGRSGALPPTTFSPVAPASFTAPTNTWTNQADFEAASNSFQSRSPTPSGSSTPIAGSTGQAGGQQPNLDWR